MGDYAMMQNKYGNNWEDDLMNEINAEYANKGQNQESYEDYMHEKEKEEREKEEKKKKGLYAYSRSNGNVFDIAKKSLILNEICEEKIGNQYLPELIIEYVQDMFELGFLRSSAKEDNAMAKIVHAVLLISVEEYKNVWSSIISDRIDQSEEHNRVSENVYDIMCDFLMSSDVICEGFYGVASMEYPVY